MKLRLLAITALCTAAGCGGSSTTQPTMPVPSPTTATVNALATLAFSPATTTIAPGGTITFAFGSVGHNVFFAATPGAPADIPGVNASVNVARTFATAGTYVYHCHIHPQMQGTIIVAATTMSSTTGGNGGNY